MLNTKAHSWSSRQTQHPLLHNTRKWGPFFAKNEWIKSFIYTHIEMPLRLSRIPKSASTNKRLAAVPTRGPTQSNCLVWHRWTDEQVPVTSNQNAFGKKKTGRWKECDTYLLRKKKCKILKTWLVVKSVFLFRRWEEFHRWHFSALMTKRVLAQPVSSVSSKMDFLRFC